MFRCFGRRRNAYLYLGILVISALALLQSFILDIFKQSVPHSYCTRVGMCLSLNLQHISRDLSTSGNSSSRNDALPEVGSQGHLQVRNINMESVYNSTSHHHGYPEKQYPLKVKAELSGTEYRQVGNHSRNIGGKINGGKSGGTWMSSVGGGTSSGIPRWQRRLLNNSTRPGRHKYFLVELLQVRIYAHDKAKWSIRELKQWIHFLFLAGVEHIYLCDHYQIQDECLYHPLKKYIELNLVTYLSWRTIAHPMTAQVECYQYIIDRYGNHSRFQMAIDMDEYPFSPIDFGEGFLPRYLKNISGQGYGHRVSEISMNNYLMLGQGDRTQDMVISRINRMTPKPANHLVKPIFKPERVRAGLHHNYLRRGIAIYANDTQLRMLHYWGARLQNWGNDTGQVLNMTVEMTGMRDTWAARVRRSLLAFGETDAFSTTTGP